MLIDLILAIAATFFVFLGLGWAGASSNERRRASLAASGQFAASAVRPAAHRTGTILSLGGDYAGLASGRKTVIPRK